MTEEFARTTLLLGEEGLARLQSAHVIVFGIGGVGSFAAEALARAGIGALTLVDADTVAPSNLNRQIIALRSTLGRPKAQVMGERVLDINPSCRVTVRQIFCTPENSGELLAGSPDYIVDAIDTVSSKLDLVQKAKALGIPIISCMGAGNKLDPTRFEVADLFETSVCPLCRVMRRELPKRGVSSLKVVYSKEPPIRPMAASLQESPSLLRKRQTPGSVSFVPSVAGLILAGEVVKDLAEGKNKPNSSDY